MKLALGITSFVLATSLSVQAAQKTDGILPELKINSTNEEENQKKSVQGEVLITHSETQAINVLIGILKKRKGSPQEPELWYRLAELYMRRAKTGRFFDLYRGLEGPVRFAPPEVASESAADNLKRAIQVYTKIENEFPKFKEMDAVLFNNAFASQQIGLKKNAEALYIKVVTQHQRSPLVADAHLALGEIKYEGQHFEGALDHFLTIEKFPQSRVYSYGMYKAAWTYYNLHNNEKAIEKLRQVVKYHDPDKQLARKINHNLRGEALRDLAIFFGESQPADTAYKFFAELTSEEELGDSLHNLGKLYLSHSRFKEMNIFLNEFMGKHPLALHRVKMQILLVEANESLKDRKQVLVQLNALAKVCESDSNWAKANATTFDQECNYDASKAKVDIAKKWWDIWLKNKSQKELAEYTQEAFRIHLTKEDPIKPDTKSRYAFAELLFQVEKFREASAQYELVGQKSADTTVKHDANYSAIVALEKAKAKDKKSTDDTEMVRLCENYLKQHANGPHVTQVKFKIGFIAYENENFVEAEKWLTPLAKDENAGEFKRKSEDLVLDILNSRKDYVGLKELSKDLLKTSNDDSRKASLTKIMQESSYAQIQELSQKGEKIKAAEQLVAFHNENKNSPLAKDSLWQAMSTYYTSSKNIDGAFLALQYSETYPEDKRTLDALKDAAQHFAEAGLLMDAAKTLELIALKSPNESDKYVEAASELYLLEGKKKETQNLLRKLLASKAGNKDTGKLLTKLMTTMKGEENSPEYKDLETKIVSQGLEPYASQIKVARVEALFKAGKMTEAFNSAKPLVNTDNNAPADVRARARLVQARVLEKEFIDTRTKTSVDRLSLVLQIKTEKLDKAQSAFLSSAKIAEDPNIKLEALHGLNRIYTNYVDTVGHPILKDESSLKDDEKQMLYAELAKLVAPIADKKSDMDKQLQSLAKTSKAVSEKGQTSFADLPAEETVKPVIRDISADKLQAYLPVVNESNMSVSRYNGGRTEKCVFKSASQVGLTELSYLIDACIASKNYSVAEKMAVEIAKSNTKAPWGNFYFSLLAAIEGKYEKSLHLAELALKKENDLPVLIYQRGRAYYFMKQLAQANSDFVRASDLGLKTSETSLMSGVVSFAQGDCITVLEEFAKLDRKTVSELGLAPVMSECFAQKGEFDRAISFAEENVKSYVRPAELYMQIARVHEVYRFDSLKALAAYESAVRSATELDAKEWLVRKVQWLKNQGAPTKVGEVKVEGDAP